MALDELEIIVDVIDSFSDELDELLIDLGSVEGAAETVDNINIDVDVIGERQLNRLQAQLMAINAQLAGMRISGVGRVGGGAGVAGAAGQAAEEASEGFELTNLRMSDLHNALAKLVPLIFVYIGALPAAIGGVLALGAAAISAAAALAAIGGLGAMGFLMARDMGVMELAEQIWRDFQDAFGPLAERLAPMFEDALDGLETLFDEIASRGDVLLALRDDARAFGSFMLEWIPNVMEAMGRMAEAFGPLFGQIADTMREMQMLRGLTQFMADAAPAFFMFVGALWEITKTVAALSIGFMKVAAVVTDFLNLLFQVITIGGLFSEQLGVAIGALLSLATAFFIVNGLASILSAELTILGGQSLVTAAKGFTLGTISAISFAQALRAVMIASGVGIALIALGSVIGFISDKFMGVTTDITDATDALREFDSVASSVGRSDFDFYGVDDNLQRRMGRASGGGNVTINVQGDADTDQVRQQLHNGLYRSYRTGRGQ